MLTKELILGILHGQKFTAKVYGSPADIISAEDFDTVAEEILLIAQPNSEPSPQLQQTPVSVRSEQLQPSDAEIEDYFKSGYGGDAGSAIYGAKWMRNEMKSGGNCH